MMVNSGDVRQWRVGLMLRGSRFVRGGVKSVFRRTWKIGPKRHSKCDYIELVCWRIKSAGMHSDGSRIWIAIRTVNMT